jgi:hypothetical protein
VGYDEIVLVTISSLLTFTITAPHRHMLGYIVLCIPLRQN